MIELLLGWLARYPIVSIEDPLAEDDPQGFVAFTRQVRGRCLVVGDDFLVSDAGRVRAAAHNARLHRRAAQAQPARHADRDHGPPGTRRGTIGMAGIVSARSGESEDVTIVHLAVGWGADQLKVGSFSRSERMAKWNEGLRIEEALGGAGPVRMAGRRSVLPGDRLITHCKSCDDDRPGRTRSGLEACRRAAPVAQARRVAARITFAD